MDEPTISRTHFQIVWESSMANEQRLNELQAEVRQLRGDLKATQEALAKALHWIERHWQEAHQGSTNQHEGQ